MEDQPSSGLSILRSKLTGEKRRCDEQKDQHQITNKRTKMRELESPLSSQVTSTRHPENEEDRDQFQIRGVAFQITNVPVTLDLDASRAERSGRSTLSVEINHAANALDLNSQAPIPGNLASNDSSEHAENCEVSILRKHAVEHEHAHENLDLNAEDGTSSLKLHPLKNQDHLKLGDVSEVGSTTGPVEEKDSLRIWKEMKRNGFISSSHGGISFKSDFITPDHGGIPMPKQRGRKPKNDVLKKKMELAKREQVDRFTKIAAPSGLLNGLNPGIINHVRNRKQVHSIIEALVRSEKHKSNHVQSHQTGHSNSETKETGHSSAFYSSKQRGDCAIVGEGGSNTVNRICNSNFVTHTTAVSEDDTLVLRLSSSTKASNESSTLSNEESTNATNVSSLSAKAASVASQWLELLHQDIKGRLTALRRSKKRVRAVITTELPFLVMKELSSNQEHDCNNFKSCDDVSTDENVSLHIKRWSTLFNQMDRALTEEEIQLETWLTQVRDMQVQCDHGLQQFHWNAVFDAQQQGGTKLHAGSGKADVSEKELAVRAAAASIYSTCNFLMSNDNVSCF
ncbi:hypothetical protein K2173_023464 [Erythroxylum novogranatense]|uniref:Cation-transporting ATPase n=1 Tax=Erythroxylum novogranatense TaxID=1862640 RepID=A0AAV8TYK6_9ROSI|nr:hypothetical protein K2173_023464 [Erythroxylum novogranatense]